MHGFHPLVSPWSQRQTDPTAYLRTCTPVLDLAGVEALLVGDFHAGKHSSAAETHWVDGALIVEQHPVRDDLRDGRQSQLKTLSPPTDLDSDGGKATLTSPRL